MKAAQMPSRTVRVQTRRFIKAPGRPTERKRARTYILALRNARVEPVSRKSSPALGVPAVQASHAPIHHDDRRGRALGAQLRAIREVRLGEGIGLLRPRLELG